MAEDNKIQETEQAIIENYLTKSPFGVEASIRERIESAVRIPFDFAEASKQNAVLECEYKTLEEAYEYANLQLRETARNRMLILRDENIGFDHKMNIAQELGKTFATILGDAKQKYDLRNTESYEIKAPQIMYMQPYMEIRGMHFNYQAAILGKKFDIGLNDVS